MTPVEIPWIAPVTRLGRAGRKLPIIMLKASGSASGFLQAHTHLGKLDESAPTMRYVVDYQHDVDRVLDLLDDHVYFFNP